MYMCDAFYKIHIDKNVKKSNKFLLKVLESNRVFHFLETTCAKESSQEIVMSQNLSEIDLNHFAKGQIVSRKYT